MDWISFLSQCLRIQAKEPSYRCPLKNRFGWKISVSDMLLLESGFCAMSTSKFLKENVLALSAEQVPVSTFLDILMSLLTPSEGAMLVDGKVVGIHNYRNWQAHIAHVPQNIYLSDSSVEENIAFGLPTEKIDTERVRKAAKQAKIDDVIENWPEKYQTKVGERGVRLSGGQRQRIGIARALYKHADVIIFDEATSALDNETERAVMEAIDELSPDLTVFIVAHGTHHAEPLRFHRGARQGPSVKNRYLSRAC